MKTTHSRRLRGVAACAALALGVTAGIATVSAPASANTPSANPIVRVDGGAARGFTNAGINTFEGLPYAAPPTGNLRWRAPQTPAGWTGVRDATQFAPSCPQSPVGNGLYPPGVISEDCLYLNVYAPASAAANWAKRPVVVWIHGGGLTTDAARNYDGTKLAAAGAVVVTINYRLGALGFLANTALASPGGSAGNYGLMDQQAALRWVQRNIGAFGGDPRNVTIAGQSAGGLSVLAQLVSTSARGLFQRAIVQSGAFALTQKSLATAEAEGNAFAAKVGCTSDVADCLRAAPVADLVNNFGVEIPGVVDGAVLTETIGSALAHQRFARVPVMNGITHDEELLFIDGLGIAVSGGGNVLVPANPTVAANYQPNIAGILGVSASRAATIAAEYPLSGYPSPDVALSLLVSDSEFACPALQVNRWTSARVPTYAYQFNDDHALIPGLPPLSTHGSELPYLFDLPNGHFPALDPSQQALASTMRAAWTRFAAVGAPSTRALLWPPYNVFGLQVSLTTPRSTIDLHAYTEHHCAFWAAG